MVFSSSLKLLLPTDAFLWRQCGTELRIYVAANSHVTDVQSRQQQPRKDRADKQLAKGLLRHHCINDRHHGWRNKNAEGAAGKQCAAGEFLVIAPLEHGGQCDHAHCHFGGPDDAADHGGKRRAGQNGGRGETALDRAEPLIDRVEKLLDHPRSLQHGRHEDEERHRRQLIIRHEREYARRHHVEDGRVPEHEQKDCCKTPGTECHGQAERQQHAERAEQKNRQPRNVDVEAHGSGSPTRDENDVLDQFARALKQQQASSDRHRQFHGPILHGPLGKRNFAQTDGIGGKFVRGPEQGADENEEKNRVMMSAIALPRGENCA